MISETNEPIQSKSSTKPENKLFTLKKWNAVAMWAWDVECDTCAICRVHLMGKFYLNFRNKFYIAFD